MAVRSAKSVACMNSHTITWEGVSIMHKFIGGDDCSRCMYCGVDICDDAYDLGFLPLNCPGNNVENPHHYISSCTMEGGKIVPSIECAYCTSTHTYNSTPDNKWECI
jgi:aspartate carbamoyltransferase regulatory subunit